VPQKGRILDVGCAEGLFLSLLNSPGWERYGMDVSTPAIESARRQHAGIESSTPPSRRCRCQTGFST
jgi:2-polyprenyl-3-methyl-5-hydroxy-6-metoxy-1,4-benzoquinol methylase